MSVVSSGTRLRLGSLSHRAQRPGPHFLSSLQCYLQAHSTQPLRAGESRVPKRPGDILGGQGAWVGVRRGDPGRPPISRGCRQPGRCSPAEPVQDASGGDAKPLPAAVPPPLPLAHVAAHGAPAAGRQQRAEPVRLLGSRGAGRGAPWAPFALGRRARQLRPRHPAGAHGGGGGERRGRRRALPSRHRLAPSPRCRRSGTAKGRDRGAGAGKLRGGGRFPHHAPPQAGNAQAYSLPHPKRPPSAKDAPCRRGSQRPAAARGCLVTEVVVIILMTGRVAR